LVKFRNDRREDETRRVLSGMFMQVYVPFGVLKMCNKIRCHGNGYNSKTALSILFKFGTVTYGYEGYISAKARPNWAQFEI